MAPNTKSNIRRVRHRKQKCKRDGQTLPCEQSEKGVGYGNPPKHSRFKPGKSGNPKGRPKKHKPDNFLSIFASDLQQKVTVQIGGREQQITKLEALATSLINNAIKGNMPAARLVVSLSQTLAKEQGGKIRLSPEEEDLLRGMLENE